jgi:hypothetical protein
MDEFYEHLSILPSIYYVGIGSAEGEWINNSSCENQQYPYCIERCNYKKTIILIDKYLKNPTYLETIQQDLPINKIIFKTLPGYKVVYPTLEIFVINSNDIIQYEIVENSFVPSVITLDLFTNLVGHILSTDSILISESFSGHSLEPVRESLADISPHNQVLYSLYFGAYFGCVSPTNYLSNIDININNGLPQIFNPLDISTIEIYNIYNNESNLNRKLQIGWIVYKRIKKDLLSTAYFLDFINRKNNINEIIDNYNWNNFKGPTSFKISTKKLYENPDRRKLSIDTLFQWFSIEYKDCLLYLPFELRFQFEYNLDNNTPYSLVQKLINTLQNIYCFEMYQKLNID